LIIKYYLWNNRFPIFFDVRQEFIHYITREKRYSKHTILSYDTDLKQFRDFLQEQFHICNFAEADHHIIRSWLVRLLESGITAKTINRKISCLKSFYKFLVRENHISVNPMLKVISPKTGTRVPEFVKESDMDLLLQEVDFGNDFTGVRNKLIFETFYSTGIRVSELINMKTEDINYTDQTIKIRGKRNKERMIPIPDYLVDSLKRYFVFRNTIQAKNSPPNPHVFITRRAKQIYHKLVYRVTNQYLSHVSTNTKKSPHTLRHSFATIMLNKGAELNSIKEMLGHSSLSATQVYTHNSIEKLKTIYKQAHPRA
jgi:integrase/recombinase XerC